MEYKKGDKVKFLNTVGGGIITNVVDSKIVNVKTHDGWDMPVLKAELVRIESSELIGGLAKEPVSKTVVEQAPPEFESDALSGDVTFYKKQTETFKPESSQLDIFLAFVPQKPAMPTDSDLDAYLINDTEFDLLYNLSIGEKDKFGSRLSGKLEANTKVYIETYRRNTLDELNAVGVQAIAVKKELHDLQKPIHKVVKISPVKFFKLSSYAENDFFHEPSIIFEIKEKMMDKLIENLREKDVLQAMKQKKASTVRPKPAISQKATDPSMLEDVIDLHITELIDDEKGMTPKDMLELQLSVFKKSLKTAIDKKQRRITFIHGLGNGKLKLELRRELERGQIKHQDASFREYGYGATMVILR